jgi:hypothetical protein
VRASAFVSAFVSARAIAIVCAFVASVVVGCRPMGPRCYQESVPPPARVEGSLLLASSPAVCPKIAPASGAACTVPTVPATDAVGNPTEVWTECEYADPSRGPCEVNGCTCRRATPDAPPTFECGPLVF